VPLSPILRHQATYPFVLLNRRVQERREHGLEVIDFGMGDPREPTDPRIIEALREGVRDRMGYPAAVGLPELREAVAQWCAGRFDVAVDPDRHVVPTLGSKEAIFSFAQVVLDNDAGRDTVVVTEPGYPVPERGALFAGANVLALPLTEQNRWLPDIEGVSAFTWRQAALVWVNYPNNPTGAIAPFSFYARVAELAREHGFVLASDEAYSELWTNRAPPSALQLDDWTNLVVFNTLSKRSSMTGFRSGFVAGDPVLIDGLRKFRPNVGTAPQEFVQRASIVAWSDEEHVERARSTYRRKRETVSAALEAAGLRIAGGDATMYVWVAVPDGETSESFALRLLELGVVVAPGSFLGPSGEGYVRFALVPTEEECARASELLAQGV
jgi:succinyldiaminopimelate transaminase